MLLSHRHTTQCWHTNEHQHCTTTAAKGQPPMQQEGSLGQTSQTARVAKIPTQQMADLFNDEHIRALQGMDFQAGKAYFTDLKE